MLNTFGFFLLVAVEEEWKKKDVGGGSEKQRERDWPIRNRAEGSFNKEAV
tara:strand:- start:269 stop:418 length:150 start_codon:yes stop_codon:yes gene_type:complete